MTDLEKIELLVNLINKTGNLNGEDFNKHPDALRAAAILFGEDELKEVLSTKKDLHLNKFYHPDGQLRIVVEKGNVTTTDVSSVVDKISAIYSKNWLKIFLIERAIGLHELELAETLILELPDGDRGAVQYAGHRLMLRHYAHTAQVEDFKKRLKLARPGKFPKNEIDGFKTILVESYAKKHGLEKTLELCKDKILGTHLSMAAIRWSAHLMSLDDIDRVLMTEPFLSYNNSGATANLYVQHFYNQRPLVISPVDFERVVEAVMKIDQDIKAGDIRYRDSLLWDLGASALSKAQTMACRKLIISPAVKKELSYYLEHNKDKMTA